MSTPEPLSPSTTTAPRSTSPDQASPISSSHPHNHESHPAQAPDERTLQEPKSPGGTNGATTSSTTPVEASSESSKAPSRKKKSKAVVTAPSPVQLHEPLQALPVSTPLPDLTDFNLRSEQLRNPLFVAISKVLIVYGNAWQSANDLVDGIRHFELANLGGRTPKGTVQGAISTALALSAALKTFEPIEKQKMNSTTYYRMAEQALLPSESGDTDPSDT
ncbi:hypothetical protein BG015_006423, partial [Linnemannia schmuckeri]